MATLEETRRRLAALAGEGLGAEASASLARCRSLRDQLRQLKREVLASIAALRAEVAEHARASRRFRPSLREAWRRRDEGAKQLLADVQERVIGMVDGKQGEVLEAWAQLNQEIDGQLARLTRLEPKLARDGGVAPGHPAAEDPGDDLYAAAGAESRPAPVAAEAAGNDDLYAAVGAEARQGEPKGGYCPHCGRGLEPGDRFCRRCGHQLGAGNE